MPNAHTREPVPQAELLLHAFFERSVRAHPERVALEIPGNAERPRRSLTYAELERRANDCAERLRASVTGECVVALLLPRHAPELYIAQLGVLKAGAAYTCLDASFPDAHAAFLLEDSRAVALVTDAAGARRARAAKFPVARILELDEHAPAVSTNGHARSGPAWLAPSSLAYVIYTSGTTGKPKGVLIEHASIANLVASDLEYFGLGPQDRMAQGSSPAYDSAVEESWLAFACGATLVVLDEEIVRRGPDLVPWLREERISVFCPPPTQLRAMGCRDPQRELPDLRLLYVGGEALPRDVADRWARGRWLENGYGPTECSVTVVRTRIREGAPITIGHAVRGNRALVLDEELREVADGGTGELCIAGASLARGYLNRPELTAEKFPVHPQFGRIYRTGDLVRRLANGELECLGRIDAQVKLRGHRIELGAIESVLAAQPGVRAAACTLQPTARGPLLAAFVVPADAARPPRFEELERALREAFPAYMVPSRFGLLAVLPSNVSGKLDRSALPPLAAQDQERETPAESARDPLEERIATVFRTALDLERVPSIAADFFLDLGGDSLAAAVAVSLLRDDPLTAPLTVRDLYSGRTVAALARRAKAAAGESELRVREASDAYGSTRTELEPVSGAQLLATSALQALVLAGELLAGAALVWAAAFVLLPRAVLALGLPLSLLVAPFAAIVLRLVHAPLAVLLLVLTKKLLIGTYRPTRVPVLSGYYLRNWIVQHVARLVPWDLLAGTEFQNAALRALGARIGQRVHLHRGVELTGGGWDLLEIGDDVMVSQDASLRLVDLVDGCLVVGPIALGAQSTVDVRAGMSAHSALAEGAFLGALSNLPPGGRVPEGECWDGVPAKHAGLSPERPAHGSKRELSPAAHASALVLARSATLLLFAVPLLASLAGLAWLCGIDARAIGQALLDGSWSGFGLVPITLALVLSIPFGLVLEALFLRALGRVPPGTISRLDPAYVRVALKSEVLQAAGDWLAGTLLWPYWLRLAGMRVGRNCEISTIIDVVPECLEIGDECFLADGIYLGGPRLYRGVVTLSHTHLAHGRLRRQPRRDPRRTGAARGGARRRLHRARARPHARRRLVVRPPALRAAAAAPQGLRTLDDARAAPRAPPDPTRLRARALRAARAPALARLRRRLLGCRARGLRGAAARCDRCDRAGGLRRGGDQRAGRAAAQVAAARPRPPRRARALVLLVQPLGHPLRDLVQVGPACARGLRGHALPALVPARDGRAHRQAQRARRRLRACRRPGHALHRGRRHRARALPGAQLRGPRAQDRPHHDPLGRRRRQRCRALLRRRGRSRCRGRAAQRGDEARAAPAGPSLRRLSDRAEPGPHPHCALPGRRAGTARDCVNNPARLGCSRTTQPA